MMIGSKNRDTIKSLAQNCVNEMTAWCDQNGLTLNNTKTNIIEFYTKNSKIQSSLYLTLNKKSITQVTQTKFLGLTIDHKLTWSAHIKNICSKLSAICFVLRKLKYTVSTSVLVMVYYGLFQSVTSYGIAHWGGAADAPKIFTIQKKAIRCIADVPPGTTCRPLFRQLKILTVPSLYILTLIMDIHQHEHTYRKNKNTHDYHTRVKEHIHIPFSRLTIGQSGHEYTGMLCYNKLPSSLKCIKNKINFKKQLKTILIKKAYYTLNEYLSDASDFI